MQEYKPNLKEIESRLSGIELNHWKNNHKLICKCYHSLFDHKATEIDSQLIGSTCSICNCIQFIPIVDNPCNHCTFNKQYMKEYYSECKELNLTDFSYHNKDLTLITPGDLFLNFIHEVLKELEQNEIDTDIAFKKIKEKLCKLILCKPNKELEEI